MRIWKTSLWEEQLRTTHSDLRHYGKLIRSTNTKRRAVLLHDGDNLLSSVEQAEKLGEGYEMQDASRTASSHNPGESSATAGDEGTIFFTYRQQESALRRTKGWEAAGADNIPYVLIKMMPRKGKAFLLNIFNSSSRMNNFPAI